MHPNLTDALKEYRKNLNIESQWLFPNRTGEKHIELRLADHILRGAVDRAELTHKGISTHSTRRTFITKLNGKGTDIRTIQTITGHSDLKALAKYIEISPDRVKQAINLI
jgi:integrase/recombinase XerD